MEVKLLSHSSLEVADIAICKCYGNKPHSDIEKVKARINRVANVSKHSSVIEHLVYSFDIDGISRACLQELARHRIASYTVKSSRYTLQELKDEQSFIYKNNIIPEGKYRAMKYIVDCNNLRVNTASIYALENLRELLLNDTPNDIAKYCMPEAYKTSLVMTINMRSLQSMLELRLNKFALWEFNQLCVKIVQALPKEHLLLVEDIVKEQINGNKRIEELKSLFD